MSRNSNGNGKRAAASVNQMREQYLERPMPHSVDAERATLGAMMLDNDIIDEAAFLLTTTDFYVRAHQFIFWALVSLRRTGSVVNPILVGEFLTREGKLEQVGGIAFLSEMTYGLPHFKSIKAYAKVITDASLVRRLIKAANLITSECLEYENEAQTLLNTAEALIFELGANRRGETVRRFDVIGQAVRDEFLRWQEGTTNAVQTGIPELDNKLKLGGLAKRDLIYVAARSSRGKTALALQFARQAAITGTPALIFSLEMSGESLYLRSHAGIANVPHWKLRPDNIRDDADFRQVVLDAMPVTDRLEIYVDDTSRTLSKIEAITRHYVARFKVGIAVGDYTQLVDPELKGNNREQEVGKVSRGFKGIAHSNDIPFVATSQLNRKTSDSERPELENLRESGQQEQDADVVMMPYNINKNDIEQPVRTMKLYVPKQRNGRAGFELDVDFDADHQQFNTEQMYADREIERINRGDNSYTPVPDVYIPASAPPDAMPFERQPLPTGFTEQDFDDAELRRMGYLPPADVSE